jgi:transcriptional regulator with XRE-family HTH domain
MIGDRIRELREARAWTQAHLADAAGVSLRTIQRLESLHSCSHETLLALAAALQVDVRELTNGIPAQSGGTDQQLWSWLQPRTAAWIGALLVLPATLFVIVNLLKYGAGIAAPYDFLAGIGRGLGIAGLFDLLSPILFVAGSLAAIALSLMVQMRPRARFDQGAMSITGLRVTIDRFNAAILFVAATSLLALFAYLVGENLPEFLRSVLSRR